MPIQKQFINHNLKEFRSTTVKFTIDAFYKVSHISRSQSRRKRPLLTASLWPLTAVSAVNGRYLRYRAGGRPPAANVPPALMHPHLFIRDQTLICFLIVISLKRRVRFLNFEVNLKNSKVFFRSCEFCDE